MINPHSQCTFKLFAPYCYWHNLSSAPSLFPQTIPTQIVTKSYIIEMNPALFTLITSDNILIEVDSTLLGKHSSVFADMFE